LNKENTAQQNDKKTKGSLLRILIILLGFVLPLIILIVALRIFSTSGRFQVVKVEEPSEEKKDWLLSPSIVLNNKSQYHQQNIVLRGKPRAEPVVCEQKKCLLGEKCCGCPLERNLVLYDEETFLAPKAKGQLRLVGSDGQAFCQRQEGSCDYDCGDWLEEAVYNVSGFFYAESPPPGWQLSLDYYFQVKSKELVRKINLGESIRNAFGEIVDWVKSLSTSGQYVLQ